jgi:outer membrane protein OmpA-like peptidoglycan-associated protein
LFNGWSQAAELDVTNFGDKAPSTDEFIDALNPESGMRMRSLSSSEPAKLRSVSLGIRFKHNSYELTDNAQEVLNRLGGALASPKLSEHKFMIEGHTDATGDSIYNQELSEKRAENVKNYLVNVFGIEPDRLEDVGRGETALLDTGSPESDQNRRVQVINLAQ